MTYERSLLYIRRYGRAGHHSHLFQALYAKLFDHAQILLDPTNNTIPTRCMRQWTTYSKIKTKNKKLIMNYQISHLFERTKNPLLFACPWNLAYVPKYLDPFTGHEAVGPHSVRLISLLKPILETKFATYIQDFNHFIDVYITQDQKLSRCLAELQQELCLPTPVFDNFKKEVDTQWRKIPLDSLNL